MIVGQATGGKQSMPFDMPKAPPYTGGRGRGWR